MKENKITELLDKLGVSQYNIRDEEITLCCPFAPWTHENRKDEHPSCGIKIDSVGSSVFNCFACGRRGTLYGMVKQLMAFDAKYEPLLSLAREKGENDMASKLDAALDWCSMAPVERLRLAERAWREQELDNFIKDSNLYRWAESRNVSKTALETWDVRYDPSDKRIVFPVRDSIRRLVGIVGRTCVDATPKYKNYWSFKKSAFLYGEALVGAADIIFLMEGMVDVVRLSERLSGCVGLFGTEVSDAQLEKLLGFHKSVCVMMDGDEAGRKATTKILEKLKGRVSPLFNVTMPEGKDPADLSWEELSDTLVKRELIL